MKCSPMLQRLLLDLADVDAALAASRYQQSRQESDRLVQERQRAYFASRSQLAGLQLEEEGLQRDLQRAEGEVHFLQRRQHHDAEAVEAASQDYTQRELRHDLGTVKRLLASATQRAAELTSTLDSLAHQITASENEVTSLQEELAKTVEIRDSTVRDMDDAQAKLQAERQKLIEALPRYVMDMYEAKREQWGAGAGRLVGTSCGVCRMELSTGQLFMIRNTPVDELLHCPECGGLLIRLSVLEASR